ncbi:MAG: DUF2490 domain-containing protein [Bacteroidales bacterium]|nr:DUF2490 domain-containing protein [Bacteroidales bacterium]
MKTKIAFIITAMFLLGSTAAMAQTDEALETEFGGRVSAKLNKKLVNRLHLTLEEEIRFDNNFSQFDRLQTTLFLNYKLTDNIKVGLGYALINGYSSSSESFKNARHRLMLDAKYTYKAGYWHFSLKERLQMTHRTGDFNEYQNPTNAITLKSRIKAQYKGLGKWSPYAYFEIRQYLNAPVISAAYDGSTYVTLDDYSETGAAGWFLSGYNGSYINRYRGCLGVDIRLDRRSTLGFYLLGDYVNDKVVDANAEGTKLKSYTKETGFVGWFGASYEYTF